MSELGFTLLGASIWAWYGLVVYWMIFMHIPSPRGYHRWCRTWRNEATALGVLGCIVTATVAARLVLCLHHPGGVYVDENTNLALEVQMFHGQLLPVHGQNAAWFPLTLYTAMQVPVWAVLDSWWAIRLWPMACGVLSVIGAYGLVRALGLGPLGGLFAAVSVAVLPWSVVYGLTSMGGEIIWHELILLWVTAMLMRPERVRIFVVASGILAGACLLYDYFAARAGLWMLIAMAPLLGRRIWLLPLMLSGIALLFLPVVQWGWTHLTLLGLMPGMGSGTAPVGPLTALVTNYKIAVLAFYNGETARGGVSMALSGAPHLPLAYVVLALAGWLVASWRYKWFAMTVFLIGILPAALTFGPTGISSHRILMAYVAPVLAAASAADRRWVGAVLFGAWIVYVSTMTVTDAEFWKGESWTKPAPAGAMP